MKFKQFLKIQEENSGSDRGLLGYGRSSTAETPANNSKRKPSNGQPFAKNLTTNAGSTPRGNNGGGAINNMNKK